MLKTSDCSRDANTGRLEEAGDDGVKRSATGLLVVFGAITVLAQQPQDGKTLERLKKLFPAASSFSPKEGTPAHYSAFVKDASGKPVLAGLAFWTTDVDPLERGYDGPIKMLVGMNPQGIITRVIVVDHSEPYGNFSIEPPAFAEQFANKNIKDPFKVGSDVDAVSRATITIMSATRAIRNSARRVARALLTPPSPATP